jgi:probable rRNA maturation factor
MINLNLAGKSPLTSTQLQSIAESVNDTLVLAMDYRIGLSFVDTKTIQELNDKYAGNNYPTDVLSFEYNDSSQESNGDIVVCTKIAESQAKENNISIEAELSLLVAHGILHILGYDHQDEKQAASLDAMQGDIMKKLNYEYRDFKWSH